jgi:hypothetical protein
MSGAHTVFFDVAFMRRFGPERRRLAERIVGFVPKYNLVPTSGGVEPYARAMTLAKTVMLAFKSNRCSKAECKQQNRTFESAVAGQGRRRSARRPFLW